MDDRKPRYVRFDWAMKNILRDKANFDILEGFISALIGQDIKINRLLESEGNQQHENDKYNRVDLLAENSSGELFIVEIQNNREVHYLHRLLYGASKLIVDHMHVGDGFDRVRKVISISIVYFKMTGGDDYVYHGDTQFYGINTNTPLKLRSMREIATAKADVHAPLNIFPEYYLLEVSRFGDEVHSAIDEWVYFFKTGDIKDEFKAKNMQAAREKLTLLRMPANERRAYESYMYNVAVDRDVFETAQKDAEAKGIAKGIATGIAIGEATGIAIGEAKGEATAMTKFVKLMLADGDSIDKIQRLTGLSAESIYEIAQRSSGNENANAG